jgi:hypothetical protein
MMATDCPFYTACRLQQRQNTELREKELPASSCYAEKVGCDDQKGDMERRCSLLANLLTRLQAAKCERELEVSVGSKGRSTQ